MKCLSIRQPWATLIILGVKRIENRSWPAPLALIGQRIAVHASASACDLHSWSEIVSGPHIPPEVRITVAGVELPPLAMLPRGAILGTVRLVACKRFEDLPKKLQRDAFSEPGGYCWLLADPQALAAPIACKGALRLWDAPATLPLE